MGQVLIGTWPFMSIHEQWALGFGKVFSIEVPVCPGPLVWFLRDGGGGRGRGETLVLGAAGSQDYLLCSRPSFITFSLGLLPL